MGFYVFVCCQGCFLGNCEMAEKLPVIIDNRGDNTVVHALQRLLPNLQRMDAATGVVEGSIS